jgi:hypothetical protein
MPLNCGEGNGVSLARRTSQSIARIARTAREVLISRDSVQAVLSWVIDRQWTVTDRRHKYRPRIDCTRTCCFAGLSPPR